ncbi:MAG: YbhB/YbcL family Raf kinase inhibitor-like protein [Lawsonibacter sp.]|jgi:Raf kinase inhibitor-like YbhB/YbcL family protein|nr:YbhB/YbcL family Raf kinase inhibitor-like protein [Lawsonibacter sp.]
MKAEILNFKCVGLSDGGKFPIEYTGRGQDISPEFILKNLSSEAETLAVTLEDLSHPIKNFTHWVIWNIPAAERIAPAVPAGKRVSSLGGAIQGIGYGLHRYAGPKPPRGKTHMYRLTLYSLSQRLDLSSYAGKRTFLRKADRLILQAGSITGAFE